MKSEYRDKLDAKYKKKIESTVRRPPKDSADPEEDLSPCPFCDTSIPSTLLVCLGCKQHIPICIVTVSYTCNLNSKFHHLIKFYILTGNAHCERGFNPLSQLSLHGYTFKIHSVCYKFYTLCIHSITKLTFNIFRMVEFGEPCPMCNAKIVGNSALTLWTETIQPRFI